MLTQYSRNHQGIHDILFEMLLFIKQTSAVIPPYFLVVVIYPKLKCDIFQTWFDKSTIPF